MRALMCERHGPPEELVIRDRPTPEPGAGEIRLNVKAAGVNFPDTLIIRDLYQTKPDLPFSPGGEAAGIVDAVGPGVTALAVGDRVSAMTTYGAFAEQVIVPVDRTFAIPDAMPFDVGAGFTMVYGTALHALRQRAHLQPGETILVMGAAGGVGLATVEVAKAMGARVIAAASSDEKLALAKAHGADVGVNYATHKLKDELKTLTGGEGVDVIFDPVGGALSEPAFRSIAWNGRHLVVGFAAGDIPSLALNLPLVKGASISGVFWGSFVRREGATNAANIAQLYSWYADGKLRPFISKRFSFEESAASIRWLMDRKAEGKVIVTIGDAA